MEAGLDGVDDVAEARRPWITGAVVEHFPLVVRWRVCDSVDNDKKRDAVALVELPPGDTAEVVCHILHAGVLDELFGP